MYSHVAVLYFKIVHYVYAFVHLCSMIQQ